MESIGRGDSAIVDDDDDGGNAVRGYMSGGGLGDIIQAQISDLQVGGRKECVAAGRMKDWLGDGGGG